jgi:hypothetical protein
MTSSAPATTGARAARCGPGDRITLERGLMRLEFPDQVEAVVEGPSRFELRSASEIDLDGGMAWFRVPEAGRGFAVLTERARVIDLGTEFGLRFDTDGTLQVHVARGEVKVEPRQPGAPDFLLGQGRATTVGSDGRGRETELRASLFRREFTHAVPYLHWTFDHVIGGAFPARGSWPDTRDYAAKLRRADGEAGESDLETSRTDGVRGKAFALRGDGLFAESAFPGIGGNTPRTVAAWIRHRNRGPRPATSLEDLLAARGVTTPYGNQAYLLHYTNSGLTTASGATATEFAAGVTYTLSFRAAAAPEAGSAEYLAELVAFDPGDDDAARVDCRSGQMPGAVLAAAEGTVTRPDMTARDQLTLTLRADSPHLGKELGIRLLKRGAPVLYDRVRLAADGKTLFAEDFESPVVRGFAPDSAPDHGWIGAAEGFGADRRGLFNQRAPIAPPYVAWGNPQPGRYWALSALPTRPGRWAVSDGRFLDATSAERPMPPDEWTHVATVATGRETAAGEPELRHYINGEPVPGHTSPLGPSIGQPGIAPFSPAAASLLIGALPGAAPGGPTLDGDIDELFLFRGALDDGEIRLLMESHSPVFPKK